jgi:predicted DNA binding protein
MTTGVHVEMVVEGIEACPVTSIGEACEVESVHTDGGRGPRSGIVGELTLNATSSKGLPEHETDLVFADGSRSVHRFNTESADCPCGRIPDHGCPVRDIRVESGSLLVSFVAPDVQVVQDIVTDLRSCTEMVRLRRLTRSAPDGDAELLFVEREAFTDRQYEALATAHEMGYFDSPRRADSGDVAARLGISGATFSEHLAVAQQKLLDQLLAV